MLEQKHDAALKKALQNNFTKAMPIFPKELLSDDEEEDEEPATTHKHNKEPTGDEESIEFVHLESDKEGDDQ
ncbi:hypothetical protein PVK06_047508 [Gossypium arboreum]|uniref:Uncharacterized protein n=1 Tax=Gossypium arboreum TaxID=29729 RepID=A0ABR0MDF6_GOSAR|nr:hypothetical protein PVK06_047508 [Gossypium arboreum]